MVRLRVIEIHPCGSRKPNRTTQHAVRNDDEDHSKCSGWTLIGLSSEDGQFYLHLAGRQDTLIGD